jgi:spermidine/putrescine transport system substrate-binding protein
MLSTLFLLLTGLVALGGSSTPAVISSGEETRTILKAVKAAAPESKDLYVWNSEDYVAQGSDSDYQLLDDFKAYVLEKDNVSLNVVYNTFSTMEEMLSNMQTNSAQYDLVCVSDYIIQRLMSLNLVVPFTKDAERTALYQHGTEGWEDNYSLYASRYLQNKLAAIHATIDGKDGNLGDYARGYMWGTLGLTYNPSFSVFKDRGLSEDDVKVQMSDWNSLWNENYKQTFQIKDSMRDTYSIGLMHVFDGYFKTLLSWYKEGKDNSGASYTSEMYNSDVNTIFNNINDVPSFNTLVAKLEKDKVSPTVYTVDSIVEEVQNSLISLKDQSFGLEVDSGKTDITTGKMSGIDTAWSGDAITSINGGEEQEHPVSLYYSIPKTGGNIWFDAWVLPQECQNKEYAQKFIDFVSRPDVAAKNMDYIGYTSFVAGDDILDLTRDNYDARSKAMYVYDDVAGDYVYDDNDEKVLKDGTGMHDATDGNGNAYQIDYGTEAMTGSTYDGAVVNGTATSWDDYWPSRKEEGANDWTKVDLSYFFKGSFTTHDETKDCLFYSDEFEAVKGTNLEGKEESVIVGRAFLAQYPSEDLLDTSKIGTALNQIPGLAVMEDYRDNNAFILKMWENVKSSGTIQPWIVIVLVVEVGAALCVGIYFLVKTSAGKTLRKKRREERKSASAQ